MLNRVLGRTFQSLKYKNYRLFFFGQLISLIGTWMQWTAQPWLVYQLTGSKVLLGIISACGTLPMIFLAIPGGMIADRVSKRRILVWTQAVMMVSSLSLGCLVIMGKAEVWHIGFFAFLSGVAVSFDMPTRQAFVIDLVGREELTNAIGLNSAIFNSARIIGPAIAGVIMAEMNIGYCFLINGLSFLAVIAGLAMLKLPAADRDKQRGTMAHDMKEGVRYILKNRDLVGIFSAVIVMGIFGWSFATLLPAFAKDILGVGEKAYGYMLTASGAGALVGALSVAAISKASYSKAIIVCGVVIFSLAAGGFSLSNTYFISVALLTVSAWGITSFFAAANSFVQNSVGDGMRGMMMGMWTFVFGGMMPLGSLQMGLMGEEFGPKAAVFTGASVCLVTIIALALYFLAKRNVKSVT